MFASSAAAAGSRRTSRCRVRCTRGWCPHPTRTRACLPGPAGSSARRAPGVLAVFTGADVARDGLGTMKMTLKRTRPDGSPMFAPAHRGLAGDRARHAGDPVGLVVAATHAQAEDAAELVRVDYEPLPSVTDT